MVWVKEIINVPKCNKVVGKWWKIYMENLWDKILEFLFISYVTCLLRETGPRMSTMNASESNALLMVMVYLTNLWAIIFRFCMILTNGYSVVKVMGISLKSSVLKKTLILTPFNGKIASNYAFVFLDKENKILLGSPPPKGSGIRTFAIRLHGQLLWVHAMYWWLVGYSTVRVFTATRTIHVRVCLYQQFKQSVTWYSVGRDWVIRCCTITRAQK